MSASRITKPEHFFRWAIAVSALLSIILLSACSGSIFGGDDTTQINAPKHCGNGVCSANEDCDSCPQDCGECGGISCSDAECAGTFLVSAAVTRFGTASGSWTDTMAIDGVAHAIKEVSVGGDNHLEQRYTVSGVPAVPDARLSIVARSGPSSEVIAVMVKVGDEWTHVADVTPGSSDSAAEALLDLSATEADDDDDDDDAGTVKVEIQFVDPRSRDKKDADTLSIDYLAISIGEPSTATCGDSSCDASEDCGSCPSDCGPCATCGDNSCDATESCSTCESDCGACVVSTCGDGACDMSETCTDCSTDCGLCPATCGDGTCDSSEDCNSCAIDCGACVPVCGDGVCEGGETCSNCESDCGVCPPTCGNGTCEAGETCTSCPGDCGVCPPVCGDGVCEGGENCTTCESDCGVCPPVCGDGVCELTESCGSCESDCGVCPPVCGDGVCEGGETCSTCENDCGTCGPTCDLPVSTVPSGKHNAGKACLGCHTGSGAPKFTLGGTLYDTTTGTNAVAGATITAVDANGSEFKLISAQNGNFWSTSAITFPVQVQASSCPSVMPMISPADSGNCNSCHGSTFRVALP